MRKQNDIVSAFQENQFRCIVCTRVERDVYRNYITYTVVVYFAVSELGVVIGGYELFNIMI